MAEIQGWECTIKADGTPKMYPAVLGTYVTRADYLAAVEKLEAEIKGYELQDGMLRKAYEDSGEAERFTWSGWLLKLVRDNAALEAEVQALREKLTQRSAPVSDEEWLLLCSGDHVDMDWICRHDLNELLAARAAEAIAQPNTLPGVP